MKVKVKEMNFTLIYKEVYSKKKKKSANDVIFLILS